MGVGKQYLYDIDFEDHILHRSEGVRRIALAAAGTGVALSNPREGKIELIAAGAGLLKVNSAALEQINLVDGVIFATIHGGHVVLKGQKLGSALMVSLVKVKKTVEVVEQICRSFSPVVTVSPLKRRAVGVVTTGSEIYHGRVEDRIGPILDRKFNALGSHIFRQIIVDNDIEMVTDAIKELIEQGVDFIAMTGGISTDPEDVAPSGIKAAGGTVLAYNAPALPGAMFVLARVNNIPIVGLPECVINSRASIFELIVPRLLANESVTRADIARLGYGGYCMSCKECRYPNCGFGKSI